MSNQRFLDKLFSEFSVNTAASFGRRSFLVKIGKTMLLASGVGFGVAKMMEGEVQAANGCKHKKGKCTEDGTKCGFNNENGDCGLWRANSLTANSFCPGCFANATDSCPVGLTKGGQWTACCLCVGDAKNGHKFRYYDCCGSAIPTECMNCKGLGRCTDGSDGFCPSGNWCGAVGGSPICTFVEETTEKCTV